MKIFFIVLALSFSAVGTFADPILFWGSDNSFGGSGEVQDSNGVAIDQATGWLVELINTANDAVLTSTTSGFMAGDGMFFVTPDVAAFEGLSVKTVIYNAPTKETAGLFAEFSTPITLSWDTSPAAPATFEYNAGSVSAGDWQAVPEPAVASLIGIFGGGLIFIKRRVSK